MSGRPEMQIASQIAQALGGTKTKRGWICPCPAHDDGTPSLSIAEGDNGRVMLYCFAGCSYTEILAGLRRKGIIENNKNYIAEHTFKKVNKVLSQKFEPVDWSDKAEYIWRNSVPLIGTFGETYFHSRGCAIPECYDMRFLPVSKKRIFPAVLARITDAITKKPITLHFTFIKPDGTDKADIVKPKILLFNHRKKGGVVRLTRDDEVTHGLGISEGIETALACSANGWSPVWAAIDAGNVANFPVLPGVECLTIFADNDINQKGIIAAKKCEKRWLDAGRDARIVMPESEDSDWNDVGGQANE